ncbi:adenylyltransferase/cytidyltransferase family protein [Patescibacteria group bacterium]|nr:adenylyltransferase/cytidyltransferase family protein [Patescibacteria group bacterium]MCL5091625.1 adenylyltransferase/cytidyltransferase family protein [Patescibacteria group bacterium]
MNSSNKPTGTANRGDLNAFLEFRKNHPAGTLVLVGGCFDILHYGHWVFLRRAKALGDRLVVMLEPDAFIRRRKHRQPFHRQTERAVKLANWKMVDWVISMPLLASDADYHTFVEKIHPQIIAVTAGDRFYAKKQKIASALGARLVVATPPVGSWSTTAIIHRLKKNHSRHT